MIRLDNVCPNKLYFFVCRFSLEIARMTKRQAVELNSNDSQVLKKYRMSKAHSSTTKTRDGVAKKGPRRPPKNSKRSAKFEDLDQEELSVKKTKNDIFQNSLFISNEPLVLLSPTDKRLADKEFFEKKNANEQIDFFDMSYESKCTPEKSKVKLGSSQSPKSLDSLPQKKLESREEFVAAIEDCKYNDVTKQANSKKQSQDKPAKVGETPSEVIARKLLNDCALSDFDKLDKGASALKNYVSIILYNSLFVYLLDIFHL